MLFQFINKFELLNRESKTYRIPAVFRDINSSTAALSYTVVDPIKFTAVISELNTLIKANNIATQPKTKFCILFL